MGKTRIRTEDPMKHIQKIFRERGIRALEMAKKEILDEKIECAEVREALSYFMSKYWRDTTRPALLSLICEAVGGKPDITTPIAVSAILTCGAADIHDDIIDQSKTKETCPTVFGKFGKEIALLAGDALLFDGLAMLYRAIEKGMPGEQLMVILDIVKKAFFELGDAEALELGLRRRIDVTPKAYLHVVEKKAAIVEGYARIGAILGGGSKEEVEALGRYGRILGILMILRDDLIDIIDIMEAQHRIKEECLPLPVLYVLQNPKIKSFMVPRILKRTVTKDDTTAIIRKTIRTGGVRRTKELMKTLAREANSLLRNIKYNKKDLGLLIRATIPPYQ